MTARMALLLSSNDLKVIGSNSCRLEVVLLDEGDIAFGEQLKLIG